MPMKYCTSSRHLRWLARLIKPLTNLNSVHFVLAAKYQKEIAEQPHLIVSLKLFDASASRVVIRYIGELHAVGNLT